MFIRNFCMQKKASQNASTLLNGIHHWDNKNNNRHFLTDTMVLIFSVIESIHILYMHTALWKIQIYTQNNSGSPTHNLQAPFLFYCCNTTFVASNNHSVWSCSVHVPYHILLETYHQVLFMMHLGPTFHLNCHITSIQPNIHTSYLYVCPFLFIYTSCLPLFAFHILVCIWSINTCSVVHDTPY